MVPQVASARAVYDSPTSRSVASFIGDANLLPAKVIVARGGQWRVQLAGGPAVSVPRHGDAPFGAASDGLVLIRPEDLQLDAGLAWGRPAKPCRRPSLRRCASAIPVSSPSPSPGPEAACCARQAHWPA